MHTVIEALEIKNSNYYTHQPKTEKKFKIVIKGLHTKLGTKYIDRPNGKRTQNK